MTELNWDAYPNFSREEFMCKCGCQRADMSPDFMERLQQQRYIVGPLQVTSGFRCSNHPVEKKKKRPGAHSIGTAADVRSLKASRYLIARTAFDLKFQGIGISKQFIHLDIGHPFALRPALWSY